MNRRSVLKGLLAVAAAAPGFRLPLVHAADYFGKLFVFVQADGAGIRPAFATPRPIPPARRSSTTGRCATRSGKRVTLPMRPSPTTKRSSRSITG